MFMFCMFMPGISFFFDAGRRLQFRRVAGLAFRLAFRPALDFAFGCPMFMPGMFCISRPCRAKTAALAASKAATTSAHTFARTLDLKISELRITSSPSETLTQRARKLVQTLHGLLKLRFNCAVDARSRAGGSGRKPRRI
jgi:hypothetical protein